MEKKIAEKFDQARWPEPQPVKRMSEDQRLAQQDKFVELPFKSALRDVD